MNFVKNRLLQYFPGELKKVAQRAVAYLIETYLGKYTKIRHDQLGFSRNKVLCVKDVELTTKAINEALEDFPFELIDGYAGEIKISLPWFESRTSTTVHVKDVDLTLRPKVPVNKAAQLLEAMSASMAHSMDASICVAAKELKEQRSSSKISKDGDQSSQPFTVEMIQQYLENFKNSIHVIVENITLRLETMEDEKVVGLEIRVDKLEYYDDQVKQAADARESSTDPESSMPLAWLIKNVQALGITVSLDDDAKPCHPPASSMPDSTGTSPTELYMSALNEVMEKSTASDHSVDDVESAEPSRATPVTIMTVAGRSDVKVKLKANETVEGPKVDISCHFGAIHALLSPKQLQFVTKIASSYASPTDSQSGSSQARALNQRMGPEDYKRVGEALQRDMEGASFEVTEPIAEDCTFLSNGEPMFFTIESASAMAAEEMDASTTSLDSASSRTPSMFGVSLPAEEKLRKKREKMAQKARDRTANEITAADLSHYQVTVGTVSVCVLHEEPHDGGGKEWVTRMEALSSAYFQGLRRISTVGQALSLAQLRDKVSAIVPRDHLGLLCKPVTLSMADRTGRSVQSFSVDLNIHHAELVECLYDSRQRGNTFTSHEPLPQYCELLTFTTAGPAGWTAEGPASLSSSIAGPPPALHLSTVITSKTGPFGYTYKDTKVSVDFGNLVAEVDITIQDRLNTLLTALSKPKPAAAQFGQSLLNMDGQYGFDEAMQDVVHLNRATDIAFSCPHVTVRVRFPIPDLRPSSQHAPREWWGRNLHKESLLLEVDHLSVLQQEKPEEASSAPFVTEVMCNKIEVYFQEDFNKTPILFASIQQGSNDVGDDFDRPRVVVKSFHPTNTPLGALEETCMESLHGGFGSLEDNILQFAAPGSIPFSLSREILYGTEGFEGEDQEGFDSTFEKVLPGNKEEMRKFMDVSAANTSLLVEITTPKLLVLLPDKPFVELLYNRFNNDLLLWEPQCPSPPEAFASGVSLNVQPYISMMNNMTQSFHEGLTGQFDSDSDDEESPSVSNQPRQCDTKYRLPSDLCLSINVGEGKVFANVPVRDESGEQREHCHGELALLAKEASLFVSVGHGGDKDMRYVTFNANRAQLFHAGCVEDSNTPMCMEHLDELTFEGKGRFQHLRSRIYLSEPNVPVTPLNEVGTGDMSEDMVSVAVQIKVDTLNNNKYFCVAAEVRGGTLRHSKYRTGESWISQVIDILDLTDYPVEGYVMPKVLTDLHIGLTGCAIDYRPENFELMTLRSLLTVQRFNLAVNLNSETKYTSIKFLLEEAKLWLSDKNVSEVHVNRDYVCIGQVALLEMGLRLGQAQEGGSGTLLWLSNSSTEIRVCADSCAAFIQLLDHFMHDRDLGIPEDIDAEELEEMIALQTSLRTQEERTDAQDQRIQEMVAEALMEHKPAVSPKGSPEKQTGGRELYFVPQSGQGQQDHCPVAGVINVIESPSEASDWGDEDDNEEEFTILDEPGLGIGPRNGEEPVVRWYTEMQALPDINFSFLTKPISNTSANELKTPAGWPKPEFKCVLREINIDLCFYGGYDFNTNKEAKEERLSKREDTFGLFFQLRLRYETYADIEEKARRLVVVVKRLEIEDHLEVSKYNKFLYWPGFDTSYDGANMVCLKLLWERPDERFNTEECSVRLTVEPIKLHINQSTLKFIQNFISDLCEDTVDDAADTDRVPSPSPASTPRREKSTSRERAPIFSAEVGMEVEEGLKTADDNLMHFGESSNTEEAVRKPERPPRVDVELDDDPTFFKSFVLTRAINITIDYTGTGTGISLDDVKTMATTAIQGVLQLENMQIDLKALECKRGYKGFAKLMEALLHEWREDITKRQIGSVVGGIGPLSIFKKLAQGIMDFFILPYRQYQKDGRVWRGFQKGALSLKQATLGAFLDLLKKVIESLLICSEYCFDFLSLGKSVRSLRSRSVTRQPKDLREGMSGAFTVLHDGFKGTFTELVKDVSQQHEQKGITGAMGYVMKAIPATVCAMPVNILSAGADQCVTGIRNEVHPERLKEEKEKYKEP